MRAIKTITNQLRPMCLIGHIGHIGRMGLIWLMGFMGLWGLSSCEREPLLHLYDSANANFALPLVKLDLAVYWNYEIGYNITYDWKAEWNYGWDDTDLAIFGEIGYTEPTVFNIRRYYTGDVPYAPHTSVYAAIMEGTTYQGRFDWGFWDLLVWNEVTTLDGVQSIHFDESTTLDTVYAYTNQSMQTSRYQAPKYTHSFYEPEALFAAYNQAEEINKNLDGFDYDAERNIYVKHLNMLLQPITYIYLTQVILRHNNGRITSVDGNGNLSGMARSTVVNTGQAGPDAITVYYKTRMKKDVIIEHPIMGALKGDKADIVGGRLMCFGLCNNTPNRVSRASEINDTHRHYMDVTMQFNNGMDSTFVFDVTDQVRERYKGGVITVVLDVNDIPIPQRKGGSGFDAVVKETEDGGTYEFDM